MKLLSDKYQKLQENIKSLGSVAVAFSSGVDSTFLLKTAVDVLGRERVIAVTADSASFPEREREQAKLFCEQQRIRQVVFSSDEMQSDAFRNNPPDRCYICKKALFRQILSIADAYGMAAVAEGSNMDDLGDYRPGLKAVAELGISSPLREAQLHKEEIRMLSKELGLPTWDKPSYACLASRFVYGEPITEERLAMVEQAEQLLLDMGFRQMRVRVHGQNQGVMARIEVLPEDFNKLVDETVRRKIHDALRKMGFSYVTLDLMGYRTGSMNETLDQKG